MFILHVIAELLLFIFIVLWDRRMNDIEEEQARIKKKLCELGDMVNFLDEETADMKNSMYK